MSARKTDGPSAPLAKGPQLANGAQLTNGAQLANGTLRTDAAPRSEAPVHRYDRGGRPGGKTGILDCIGIGFGPSNIALAVALEERGVTSSTLFLESAEGPDWQPDMLLRGSDIQHNPLRDFATPRNPRSRFGFLSFLHEQGRLMDFLRLEAPFPPRLEYAAYVRWVAEKFDHLVRYGDAATRIDTTTDDTGNPVIEVRTESGARHRAYALSFAPGRSRYVPPELAPFLGPRVVHADAYLGAAERWKTEAGDPVRTIGVLGGSQSAVEIILDLTHRLPGARIVSIGRSFGFKLKDVSPFTEKIYTPEFIDYFYNAAEADQARMTRELWRSNYGAADHDVVAALDFALYEQSVLGDDRIRLLSNQRILAARAAPSGGIAMDLVDRHSGAETAVALDAVVLATGYRNFGGGEGQEPCHPLLERLARNTRFRTDGGVAVARDFRLLPRDERHPLPPVFINGLCESTHGFGDAGSFSLLSIRSDVIAASLERLGTARAVAQRRRPKSAPVRQSEEIAP